MITLNETHDPELRAWVPGSDPSSTGFPIQNLPFGRFHTVTDPRPRIGVAIGEFVLDLNAVASTGLLTKRACDVVVCSQSGYLNALMAQPPEHLTALRLELSRLLRSGSRSTDQVRACLVRREDAILTLAVDVRNFTDFLTSDHHSENTGRLKRPESPLLPNFHSMPIAYHGRASTVVESGRPLRRPYGQWKEAGSATVRFGPTRSLDFECELGTFIGTGNEMGERVALTNAPQHVFGYCVLNDWSARDIQIWEAQPLGPFLSKSFQTSVSPWIVTIDAMAPFRCPAAARRSDAPELLPYLSDDVDRSHGGLAIDFEISLCSELMRTRELPPHPISRPRFKDQYWTVFQMLTHHASNGCRLLPGDLLGSGTVSGAVAEELGCLLELTVGRHATLLLPTGEEREFLCDGDEVIISAECKRPGFAGIGLGSVSAVVLAARE